MAELSIVVCTYNVATLDPPKELLNDLIWLHTSEAPDLYAVGLQEVSSKPHEVIQSTLSDDPWTEAISTCVCEKGYVMVSSIRLQGIVQLLFARMVHLPFLRDIQTDFTRTGLGGTWGNKGAVTIRLDCYERSLCLINTHLAAHMENWADRDKEYHTIVTSQTFSHPKTPTVLDHDYIIWFGDLNYRIEDLSVDVVKFLSTPKKLHVLLEKDQLKLSMRRGQSFEGFREGPVAFIPTYKFDFQTDDFDTSAKQRPPAWTDRVLWKVHPKHAGEETDFCVTQMAYRSHGNVKWSDHKPVSAEFRLGVSMESAQALVTFDPIESWRRGEDAQCTYTVVPGTRTSNWDWVGLYKVGFQTPSRSYVTYVWAVPNGETRPASGCQVTFKASYLPQDIFSKYVLCYFSKVMNCVLGVSNVFRILPSEEDNIQFVGYDLQGTATVLRDMAGI
ncbi:phosphatidylinositol 4,5-bisphosphate 5-phosphatase A-like [Patiria miniata]|uniref:Inositol polyphosphate-related phosphatase domain-containing protein n=1 Tax=Patiria miniata TaxID=46514 RepID=A0A914A4X7_PATMI|nr:phosphatidylinositol 4,5-bisphosphate 5-phosphatase A-like [Patiria miniata]